MSNTKTIVNSALAAAVMLGGILHTVQVSAAEQKDVEKCYGVVKAGKNDCQTTNNACAGHSTADSQQDAWVYLPKGTCDKIVGGSTTSPKS